MLFSSLLFLFYFFPIVLILYIVIDPKYRNKFLLLASLIFFAWGGVTNTIIFLGSIILNYFTGILIDKYNDKLKLKKTVLILAVLLNVIILCVFKYLNFFIDNINEILKLTNSELIKGPKILLPIGISFYTFHGLSYIIDVYRKTTTAQKKISDLGLYISFFPQLIAGPIIRYKDVSEQLTQRTFGHELLNKGIYRFLLGLGKKVLIANTLAVVADSIFKINPSDLETTTAWIGILAYTFQIYFDFSGYSDMAIGLALVFGFKFRENFDFPYMAQSIKDFWRKWHISLSFWFRDYLYIPLGGNQKGSFKTYRNLIIVFFVTGFWHGPSWSFVVWGLIHGLFIIIERLGVDKILEKLWSPVRVLYTFFVVAFAWVLFKIENFDHAINYYKAMFTNTNPHSPIQVISNEINKEQMLIFIIAITGSFGMYIKFEKWIQHLSTKQNSISVYLVDFCKVAFCLSILFLSTLYIVSGSYNPFIYFKF